MTDIATWGEPDVGDGIEIVRGAVVVNYVDLVLEYPNARIYNADLKTKYAEVASYALDETTVDVLLKTTPNSLHVADCGDKFTTISLSVPPGNWDVVAECARYTLNVCLWKIEDDDE